MSYKLINFDNSRERIWLEFVAQCKINKIKVGEKNLDLIEEYLKKGKK